MPKNILVSVAWPYASGSRHLGHIGGAYLPADIFARYHRAIGNNVLMVSGSDVHGTPITVRADAEGVQPIDIVNRYHNEFLGYWEKLGISWDNYTTTMTDNHKEVTQEMFLKIKENGFIEKNKSIQAFDPQEKKFLPDRYVEGTCPCPVAYSEARGDQCDSCGKTLDPEELINPISKISGNKAEFKETEHYFLKLSALNDRLSDWLNSKEGWRPHVINFSKSFVDEGLQDRAITRDLDWGIEIPDNELGDGKKIYVWFEAVIGYLSASIEWSNNDESRNWEDWWKNKDAESYYFIGKDNVPFHSVIWPAILAGYGDLNLPTNVPANQYILIKGEKASASRSVGKSLSEYLEEWEPDAIRYTLASVLPEQADSELSESEMIRRNNEELVATWGNLVQRVFTQIENNIDNINEASDETEVDTTLLKSGEEAFNNVGEHIEKVELKAALQEAMRYVSKVNIYLNETEPWKIIGEDSKREARILYTSLTAIDACSNLLSPFMPSTSEKVSNAIPKESNNQWSLNSIKIGTQIETIGHLFKKFD